MPLYAVLLQHEAYPAVDSDLLNGFRDWLQAEHVQDVGFPATLQALRQDEHIALVLTNTQRQVEPGQSANPQNMPWQNYRSVLYVAGDEARLNDVLELLHRFFVHRVTHRRACDRSPWPPMQTLRVHVRPHLGVTVGALEAVYTRIPATLHDPAADLPMHVFSVAPPTGFNALKVEVEVVDGDSVVLAWEGRTYVYRQRFQVAGIPLVPEFNVRVLPQERRDVSDPANLDFVQDVFGNAVLRNAVSCITWTGEDIEDDSPVARLRTALMARRNLFLDAF